MVSDVALHGRPMYIAGTQTCQKASTCCTAIVLLSSSEVDENPRLRPNNLNLPCVVRVRRPQSGPKLTLPNSKDVLSSTIQQGPSGLMAKALLNGLREQSMVARVHPGSHAA